MTGSAKTLAVRAATAVRGRLPRRLQAWWWDAEYARGRWSYLDGFPAETLADLVTTHSVPDPEILDLGCGSAKNLGTLADLRYHGVDISRTAIEQARALHRPRATFEVADIAAYVPARRFDVVLLREVLYYLPPDGVRRVITRLPQMLRPDGICVVQIWNDEAHAHVIRIIREADLRVIAEPDRSDGGVNLVLGHRDADAGRRA